MIVFVDRGLGVAPAVSTDIPDCVVLRLDKKISANDN